MSILQGVPQFLSGRAMSIAAATTAILNAMNYNWTFMGTDEWCCGNPLLAAGQLKDVEKIAKHNIKTIKRQGADTVVTSCPGCYRVLADEYIDINSMVNFMVFVSLLPIREKEAYLLKSIREIKDKVKQVKLLPGQSREKNRVRIFPNIKGVKFTGRVMEDVSDCLKKNHIPLKFIEEAFIRHDSTDIEERKIRKIPAFHKAYIEPLNADQYLDGAIFFLSLQRMDEAIKWLEKAYESGVDSPWHQPLAVKLAQLYFKRGEKGKSREIFEALIKKYPLSRSVRYGYGEFLYKEGAFKPALEMFRNIAVKSDAFELTIEDREKMNFYRAVSLIETDDLEKAEKILAGILTENPLSSRAVAGLAYLAAMGGDIEGCAVKIGRLSSLIDKACQLTIHSIEDLIHLCLNLIEALNMVKKEEEAEIISGAARVLLEYAAIIRDKRKKQCQIKS